MDAAFEFVAKLGAPFYCFHDRDIAPEGDTFAESASCSTTWPTVPSDCRPRRACGSCGAPPTCSHTRVTWPAPCNQPGPRDLLVRSSAGGPLHGGHAASRR